MVHWGLFGLVFSFPGWVTGGINKIRKSTKLGFGEH